MATKRKTQRKVIALRDKKLENLGSDIHKRHKQLKTEKKNLRAEIKADTHEAYNLAREKRDKNALLVRLTIKEKISYSKFKEFLDYKAQFKADYYNLKISFLNEINDQVIGDRV